MSLNVAGMGFPLMVTVAPDWKPLPRMVRMVPPEAGAEMGEMVPMESGTVASWIMVTPEVVSAKILWPFSSMARKLPWSASISVDSVARGSGKKTRRRRSPVWASRMSMPPWTPMVEGSAGAGREHCSIAGGSEIDDGFFCERGSELIGRCCGPEPDRAAGRGVVSEEDLIAGGVGLN